MRSALSWHPKPGTKSTQSSALLPGGTTAPLNGFWWILSEKCPVPSFFSKPEDRGRAGRLKLAQNQVERRRLGADYQWVFEVEGIRDLEVSLRVTDVPGTGHIELKPRVHNRRASVHPNGCWDLGDPNSLYIDSFSVKVTNPRASDTRLELRDLASHPAFKRSYPEGVLVQYGSGGKHWDSPVHVDKNGQSTVPERGFKLFDNEGGHLAQGLRASPLVRFDNPSARRYLIPGDFWENFPSSLEVKAPFSSL